MATVFRRPLCLCGSGCYSPACLCFFLVFTACEMITDYCWLEMESNHFLAILFFSKLLLFFSFSSFALDLNAVLFFAALWSVSAWTLHDLLQTICSVE